eukprot:CAMPEP_0113701314 /NCGR_PEP_ID=MMETSP0038_2-20120614/24498_1 /TAXON_ID=2898 /ORGANISM="Cryptomonas paramecium" /LENGTH=97 /DNA_ID=CAMNT_0000625177 /DNA_START=110 /DNA_END=400 /DNA_ORIENTATION=- /assembly_acc=CAM_ASM_000170
MTCFCDSRIKIAFPTAFVCQARGVTRVRLQRDTPCPVAPPAPLAAAASGDGGDSVTAAGGGPQQNMSGANPSEVSDVAAGLAGWVLPTGSRSQLAGA